VPSAVTTNGEWLVNHKNIVDDGENMNILETSLFSIKLAEHGSFGFGFGMKFSFNLNLTINELTTNVHFTNPDTTYFYPHSYFFQNAYEERILDTI
jgi:hypothetical protein